MSIAATADTCSATAPTPSTTPETPAISPSSTKFAAASPLGPLPIGAYSPHGFLHVHMDPEDAVRAFLELDARHFVPMHYGTFRLSAEPMEEPLPRLLNAAEDAGITSAVDPIREGETRIFSHRHTSISHLPPRSLPSRLKGAGSAPLEGFAH